MAKDGTGLTDALAAFALISSILALNDLLNKRKAREEKEQTAARLANIEMGVKAIHAKLV